jgi:hypothetical protein
MGSPLSPVVADLVLQALESKALLDLSFKPPFYVRYVDDIALAAPTTHLEELIKKFNSFHPRLKFTVEIGGESLNYLEVTIIKRDGQLIFDWYQKPTFSGRFLNFHSQHPIIHKKGTIISLVDKVLELSHPEFQAKNFSFITEILLDNNYPLEMIFSVIKKRLSTKFHLINNNQKSSNSSDKPKENYFTIPYIYNIGEKFIQFFKNIPNFKLAFYGINKLNKIVKVHKDPLPPLSRANVVYRINCLNCEASYVGQTRRILKNRIDEHRNHIRRNTIQTSVITEHRLQFSHDFDWNNVEVLDEEVQFNKRLISEMIHIKRQKKRVESTE